MSTTKVLPIRPGVTMSKMGVKVKPKKEAPISDETFALRKLDIYNQYYISLYPFRRQREKAARYFNGDQWHETMLDKYGNPISEHQHILNQGKIPLKQNLIKSTIRSLEGQFRSDTSKSVVVSRTPDRGKESEMLSNALQYSLTSINNAKELDARSLEELLISGLPIQRIGFERVPSLGKRDVVVRNVHPNTIFFNGDIQDIRGNDIHIIGQLHDWTINDVLAKFANSPEGIYSEERAARLKQIYSWTSEEFVQAYGLDPRNMYGIDFYIPKDQSKCRVIEVWEERIDKVLIVHDWMNGTEDETDWTPADVDRINQYRIAEYGKAGVAAEDVPLCEYHYEMIKRWYFTYYSPQGHVLREGITPYWHKSHPFVVLPYPLLDGKIVGLATDLIDAQRQVNRLLILQDMILSSSVKNTLVIDKNAMDGKSPEEIGQDYKEIGGVVVLDVEKGKNIQGSVMEIKGSIGNLGIPEMIQLYIRMLQDVSGVHPAMQGQQAQAGTSGVLYAQQAQNSTLNSKDIMESFGGLFRTQRDMKLLKTIQQYYDEPRMLAIAGKSYTETAQLYDPAKVRDIEFDMVIGQTSDSPVYRDIIDQTLKDFVDKGLIDLEMFLENTSLPFSNQLLESLRRRKEQAQTNPQEAIAGLSGDVQQAGLNPNQQVVNAVYDGTKAA